MIAPASLSLRERKKAETRRTLQREALRLFAAKGYEATTVEEIAGAAGVSSMTFFRYFPTKEDVVMQDYQDDLIESSIGSQPADRPPIERLQHGLRASLAIAYPVVRESLLARMRLIQSTPALRARLWEHLHETERLIARALSRGAERSEDDLRSRIVAAACVGALSATVAVWAEEGGTRDLPALMDEALTLLREEMR